MPIDLFDTRTMSEAVQIMKQPRTFLRDTFFTNHRTFVTEFVDIDVIVGKRRMAPFVSPKLAGKVMERAGYKTDTYTPPLVNPKFPTTAELLQKRAAGEPLY